MISSADEVNVFPEIMGKEMTRDEASELYNVERWGAGYFSINKKGHLCVCPRGAGDGKIDLMDIVEEAKERKLPFPLTVRFHDLLRHRVETLNRAFASAIEESGYRGVYRGVFPVKVNQLREVVEEILDAGAAWHFGIEAGSKPELMAAMAAHSDPESLIVCNGYKDRSFIRTALLGRKLGKRVILVVEKLEELTAILKESQAMSVEPMIGVRVRLLSKGAGKWATSGGENAKFGLSTADLVAASDMLHEAGLADALKLVHFHVGSQIPDIGIIKRAAKEASRFYAKLKKMGHALGYLDVGGGLGVDYDGSRTTFDSSTNYSLEEYARDIVYSVMEVCNTENVEHPTLVSESGRALVAYHSVLLVESFGSIEKNRGRDVEYAPGDPQLVADIIEIRENIKKKNLLEYLHDAQEMREGAQSMFELGLLGLRAKAKIESVYWGIVDEVVELYRGAEHIPDEVKDMETSLADQYLCNFSVFQSLLDHWALGQLFPIMPIHRLDETPDRQAVLVDITCDSDGKVSKFVDLRDVKDTLPLHTCTPDKPYYIGIFLVGAYQDILGDMHNLFGRINEMHIYLDDEEDCDYYVEEVLPGETVSDVLSLTQWDTKQIARSVKKQIEAAIRANRLKPSEAMRLLDEYESILAEYTYLRI